MSDQDQLVKRLATSFCGHAQCLKERGDAATAIQKQAATIAAHEATIKELREQNSKMEKWIEGNTAWGRESMGDFEVCQSCGETVTKNAAHMCIIRG